MKLKLSCAALTALNLFYSQAYAFEETGLVITPDIVEKSSLEDCSQLAPNPNEDTLASEKTEATIKQALCRYFIHQKKEQSSGLQQEDLRSIDLSIQNFAALQTKGLPSSVQALSTMMNGSLHCALSNHHLEVMNNLPQNTNGDKVGSVEFCSHRKAAIEEYGSILWKDLHIKFDTDVALKGYTLQSFVENFSQCYETALNSKYDKLCGITKDLTDEIPELTRQVYEGTSETQGLGEIFFGVSGPIFAMFERKQGTAQKTIDNLSGKIDILSQKSKSLCIKKDIPGGNPCAESSQVGALYGSVNTHVWSVMDDVMKNYQESYAVASAVLERWNAWKGGLFIDPKTGENLLPKIQDAIKAANEVENAVKGENGILSTLESVDNLLTQLEQDSQQDRKIAKQLCQAFYCKAAVKLPLEGSVLHWPYEEVCYNSSSGLCELVFDPDYEVTFPLEGQSFTLEEFCTQNGFPSKFQTIGLSEQEAQSCLN